MTAHKAANCSASSDTQWNSAARQHYFYSFLTDIVAFLLTHTLYKAPYSLYNRGFISVTASAATPLFILRFIIIIFILFFLADCGTSSLLCKVLAAHNCPVTDIRENTTCSLCITHVKIKNDGNIFQKSAGCVLLTLLFKTDMKH